MELSNKDKITVLTNCIIRFGILDNYNFLCTGIAMSINSFLKIDIKDWIGSNQVSLYIPEFNYEVMYKICINFNIPIKAKELNYQEGKYTIIPYVWFNFKEDRLKALLKFTELIKTGKIKEYL